MILLSPGNYEYLSSLQDFADSNADDFRLGVCLGECLGG